MWWLLAVVAWSAEIGIVGLHDVGLDEEAQRTVAAALVGAVESGGRHDGLTPEEVAARIQGREDRVLQDGLLVDGKRLMEDGRLLFQQALPEDAAFSLESSVRSLEEGVRWTRSVRELWEAWMLLATARLAVGNEAGARDAIGAAVALHPQRRPDPAAFPPDIVTLHEMERRVASGEGTALMVDTVIPGAEVWVDGRAAGRTPVRVDSVPSGKHFVHVRSESGTVGFATVEVASRDTVVKVDLAAPVIGGTPKTAAGRSSQTQGLYSALGRTADIDVMVLVGRVDGVLQVQLFSPDTDAFGRPVVLAASASPEALGEAVAVLVADVGSGGELPMTSGAYTALALDIAGNRILGRMLLAPVKAAVVTSTYDPGVYKGPAPQTAKKPKWPVWLGVGLSAAAVVAGGTALGVVLGGNGAGPPTTTGTIVVGPPP